MPQPTNNLHIQNCLARALFDNVADTPDELEFSSGDVLTVLEQNASNIEGWWLCSLKGRQGMCPANRLRLLPGVYEGRGDFSSLQRQGKRRSWHEHPNQVVTPKKYNDVYYYDTLPKCSSRSQFDSALSTREESNDYDTPPRAVPLNHEGLRNCPRCSPASSSCVSPVSRDGDVYDVPRSHHNHNQLTPSSSASSLTGADSLSSSNRSSLNTMPDYDIPKPQNKGPQLFLYPSQTYDVPPSHTLKELPLELNSALENLERLETDATNSIQKLLGFVGPNWRTKDKLNRNVLEIKLSVTRLQTSLNDLAEFSEGTLGNATKASDKNLATKLAPLVSALRKSYDIVRDATENLNELNWSVERLSKSDDDERSVNSADALEHLIACSKALTEDIRQIASFIQGNGLLLFKKDAPIEWTDDYDYVRLDSKDSVMRKHSEIRNAMPNDLRKGYDNLVKHADDVSLDKAVSLDSNDKHILTFFSAQLATHYKNLTDAIDAFLHTVEQNQPPKIFLAHGKFVVLSAHKLVSIGDTVHRNVSCKEVKESAFNCSNALSDVLEASVNKTKQAALQFPTVAAVQEMVDGVLDISHAAHNLKICLLQATANVL